MMKTNITLLRGRGKKAMHFSSNADQLDDPVILPMPTALQNLHLVLHVVQFNDLLFFLSHSPLLGGLGLVRGTFLRTPLLGGRRDLGVALDGRCQPDTRKPRHEGVRKEERHLTTMVWITWKEC